MKNFFIKLTIFLLPVLIVVLIFEYNLGNIQNSYNFKKSQIEKKLPEIEILVVGNSQAFYGINPGIWPIAGFNLANVSQSLQYDTYLIQHYVDQLPRLKFVVIPIEYLSLGYEMKDTLEEWRMFFYERYWAIRPLQFSILDLRRYSLIELYGRSTTLKFAFKQFEVNLADNINRSGAYESEKVLSDPSEVAALKRIQYHNSLIKEEYYNQNILLLEQLLTTLKKKNITPVLISSPVSTYYFKLTDKEKLTFAENTAQGIASQYNLKYFNHMNDIRFVTSDFSDYDHLNVTGANKFSLILYDEITSISKNISIYQHSN